MTQEDKELLFKDLCARLPYGVKFLRESWIFEWDQELSVIAVLEDIDKDGYINNTKVYRIEDIKPYLFPLSSMTEEQKSDYQFITERWMNDSSHSISDSIDWLNAHHFNYRGLIEKGLVIDATGLNVY